MKTRKRLLFIIFTFVVGSLPPAVGCSSHLANEVPLPENQGWKEIRDEIDRGLRERFPEYYGLYHHGSPYALVLLHGPMRPEDIFTMCNWVNNYQSIFDPVLHRELKNDGFVEGVLRGFEMPPKLRERYRRMLQIVDAPRRNAELAQIVGEMFPGVSLHLNAPPLVNIDWEMMINAGFSAKAMKLLVAKFPRIEFMPKAY